MEGYKNPFLGLVLSWGENKYIVVVRPHIAAVF